jgi:hypothetical protein
MTEVDARALEGRWIIFVCTGCGEATGRHQACDAKREATPVVPVDEAAVERVAQAIYEAGRGDWQGFRDAQRAREVAEFVLRAAGEQS